MTEGESIADRETLVRLAEDVGLEGERVRAMLASDELTTAVREDENAAAAMGVRGVPFFVVDEKYGVSGAQPAELLLEVLQRRRLHWDEVRCPGRGGAHPFGRHDRLVEHRVGDPIRVPRERWERPLVLEELPAPRTNVVT